MCVCVCPMSHACIPPLCVPSSQLFKDDAKKKLVYAEAVKTVDPQKAVGKPHTLWVEFAKLFEKELNLPQARALFKKVCVYVCECVSRSV